MKHAELYFIVRMQESPPHTGGRGLKPEDAGDMDKTIMSPPHTGGRGLKRLQERGVHQLQVAPSHGGARIETTRR